MVLMETLGNLPRPNAPPTQLVKIATFSQQHITGPEAETVDLIRAHSNSLDLPKVKMSILHIRNSQVRPLDCIAVGLSSKR